MNCCIWTTYQVQSHMRGVTCTGMLSHTLLLPSMLYTVSKCRPTFVFVHVFIVKIQNLLYISVLSSVFESCVIGSK